MLDAKSRGPMVLRDTSTKNYIVRKELPGGYAAKLPVDTQFKAWLWGSETMQMLGIGTVPQATLNEWVANGLVEEVGAKKPS